MKKLFAACVFLLIYAHSYCCTSIIISGRFTKDGRPVMMKHRDTGELNNRIGHYEGPLLRFIGLEDSPAPENGVWAGTNSAGFCIMNTASYNIKNDDVPDELMDREGSLMFTALGICRDLKDFENLLDTLSRPMGVEANFGIIDACGGAAYYEVNNDSWIKHDVNLIPEGYKVVTNFSESGPMEKYQGYERYVTASAIASEILNGKYDADHSVLINSFSRSYRHEILGIDYVMDYDALSSVTSFSGIIVDQDFIPRRITSASIVFEGVREGENPAYTVMWTLMGYPACSFYVPLVVGNDDMVPTYLSGGADGRSRLCDAVLDIKNSFIFNYNISNGSHYLRLDAILKGSDGRPPLIECSRNVEKYVDDSFGSIYDRWISGQMADYQFYEKYRTLSEGYYDVFRDAFSSFIDK